jgi:homoserine kinase
MKKMKESIQSIRAFAPATCANVAVGFDILGFSIESIGDYVTLTKRKDKKIIVESIDSQESLPFANNENTASVVVQKFCQELNLESGFSIHIKKGIPLCSGMGGSAASAVAALVACNAFLVSPLSTHELAYFALLGEKVASGTAHADNIIPCLFGGLTLIFSKTPLKIIKLPIPDIYCVLLHPHLQVPTRTAREALKKEVALTLHVQQSAHLAAFIAALYEKDTDLLKQTMNDVMIETQRAKFVPEFYKVKDAALQAGAIGMSFSGGGPSMFAFTKTKEDAERVGRAMQLPLQKKTIISDYWLSKISKNAAHVVEEKILCNM